MGSRYTLSAVAAALFVDGTGIASLMPGATLTVYDGKQPVSADTAVTADNHILATFAFTNAPLGVYGSVEIGVLDPLPDTPWLLSGTPSFARATNGSTKIFDCSVGTADTDPDLVIRLSPVRAGDVAHLDNGKVKRLGRRRRIDMAAEGIFNS